MIFINFGQSSLINDSMLFWTPSQWPFFANLMQIPEWQIIAKIVSQFLLRPAVVWIEVKADFVIEKSSNLQKCSKVKKYCHTFQRLTIKSLNKHTL